MPFQHKSLTACLGNPDSSFLTPKEGVHWYKLLVNLAHVYEIKNA